MTTNPILPEISPLEDRAIRRFEYDLEFHVRCHTKAKQLETAHPNDELGRRLQDAMRELQAADEAIHDEASIVRGAKYLGELFGVVFPTASVARQEGLKAAVRRVLAAVEGSSNG